MKSIPTQLTIAPRGKSWHGEYLRDDALGSPVRPAAPAWIEGAPPAGIEAAWLRLESPDEDGEMIASVVLGCKDADAAWCEAADWECESYMDSIESDITHWMLYAVPSARLA